MVRTLITASNLKEAKEIANKSNEINKNNAINKNIKSYNKIFSSTGRLVKIPVNKKGEKTYSFNTTNKIIIKPS